MTYKDLTIAERRRFKTRAICIYCHQPVEEFDTFNYSKVARGKTVGYIWWHMKCEKQYFSNQLETSVAEV